MDKKYIKLGAAMVGAVLVGGVAGSVAFPKEIEKPIIVNQTQIVEVPTPFPVEKIVEVEVEKIKEVIKNVSVEVPVLDEDKAKMFCDRMLYEDVSECIEEVEAEDLALNEALAFIESDFDEIADEMEDKGIVEDEDEVSVIKVYDSFEDVNIIKSDFDDEEYKFEIRVKVEDLENDDKKYVLITLEKEDNEIKFVKVKEE